MTLWTFKSSVAGRCFFTGAPCKEMELGGIEKFISKNGGKKCPMSELVWLLTNSDEMNLNSQNINKKFYKLNADSLGEQNYVMTRAAAEEKHATKHRHGDR